MNIITFTKILLSKDCALNKPKLAIAYYILNNIKIIFSKVEKVLTGYPSYYAGLKVHDFLISVNGQEVFEMNHAQVCTLVKNTGGTLNLSVER